MAGPRPPCVVFTWEELVFQGVVKSAKFEVNLFDAAGRPKRATVALQLLGRAFASPLDAGSFFGQLLGGLAASFSPGSSIVGATGIDPRLDFLP
jgi:hypothetical protein